MMTFKNVFHIRLLHVAATQEFYLWYTNEIVNSIWKLYLFLLRLICNHLPSYFIYDKTVERLQVLLWNKLWQKCYDCIKTTKWNKSFLFTYMRGLNLWACLQSSHFTTRCFGHESQILGVIYGISFWRIWAHGTLWNFFNMVGCSKGWCSLQKTIYFLLKLYFTTKRNGQLCHLIPLIFFNNNFYHCPG